MGVASDVEAHGASARGHPQIRVDDLTVSYGAVRAVDSVSMEMQPGCITGLIGPNGAGKTSLIDALTGFTGYTGSVRLDDRRLDGQAPHRRQRLGLSRTFQAVELFEDLSVEQNVVSSQPVSGWALTREVLSGRPLRSDKATEELLERFDLAAIRDERVADLSHGHQKIVAIARAIAARPHALLLDEPAAGLDTEESQWLGSHLRSLAETGMVMLLVEHDLDLVLRICDDLYVLDFGKLIASGGPQQVVKDPAVVSAYIGDMAVTGSKSADMPATGAVR